MKYLIKQLETGEFVDLAFYNDLQQAFEIAELLNALWLGEYLWMGKEQCDR